jgi:hypothetical protein
MLSRILSIFAGKNQAKVDINGVTSLPLTVYGCQDLSRSIHLKLANQDCGLAIPHPS